jgi:assimilatory nitrate reductase catalytic subunit
MISTNTFLQGIFAFTGEGLDRFAPVGPGLTHNVPDGRLCQALYFRGGNSTDELVVAALLRDGALMRLFPIGAKSDVHVPLRVVEDIDGGSVVELKLAAPSGTSGTVVVDLGMVEH